MPDMNWKSICAQWYFVVVLETRVPITFPSGLDTDFAPQERQPSGSKLRASIIALLGAIVEAFQWDRGLSVSLHPVGIQVSPRFDVRHLPDYSCASRQSS